MREHVVIAGAGIIGLAAALELAGAGFAVTVVEPGRAMRESSWAAAGMLAVEDPENAPELLPLARLSASLYPEFLDRVERLSGLGVPLRTSRTLQGVPRRSGDDSRAGALLPGLRTDAYSFRVLEEASLDPRDLCAALPRAALAAGVIVREGEAVRAVEPGRVELADGETLQAAHCVLASGAWAGLLGLPKGAALPVVPRKGQMIEVLLDGPALPIVLRTPELYLVPRGDGRVAIGATVEDAGFSRDVDERAGDFLWKKAAELWPPVLQGRIVQRWTGLRPGTPDALPVLGQANQGVWVASGHFRNGILLAPGTGRVVRQLIAGQPPAVSLEAFSARRFAGSPEMDRAPDPGSRTGIAGAA